MLGSPAGAGAIAQRNWSMVATRNVLVPVGLLLAGLFLHTGPAHAQYRQPEAELSPLVGQEAIRPGQTMTIELRVKLPEGIHVQSDDPRDPYVIPTVLTFTPPERVTVADITYPAATDFLLEGWEEPLAVFDSEFTIEAELVLAADAPPGELVVPGSLLYQSCDDKVCFPPATAAVEWRILVEPAGTP